MPAPIVLSTLDPETKRVPNPPPGEPVIATDVRFRDGSRAGGTGSTVDLGSIGNLPRIEIKNLEFQGGFRLQGGTLGASSLNDAEGGMSFRSPRPGAPNGSLYVSGNFVVGGVGEFAIPDLINSQDAAQLNIGAPLQSFVDTLQRVSGGSGGMDRQAEVLYVDGQLLVSCHEYYPASDGTPYNVAVYRDADDLAAGAISGYFKIDDHISSSYLNARGGSGWFNPIPAEYQSLMEGTHLFGPADRWNVEGRNGEGPEVFTFNPGASIISNATVGDGLVNSIPFMDWKPGNEMGFVHQAGLGYVAPPDDLWNNMTHCHGGCVIGGTRTVAFFGKHFARDHDLGYKITTLDSGREAGGPAPFYDADSYNYYWLFDLADVIAVKNGSMTMADIEPYSYGVWELPYQWVDSAGNKVVYGAKDIRGIAYDPDTGNIIVQIKGGDYTPSFSVIPAFAVYRANPTPAYKAPAAVTGLSASNLNIATTQTITVSWSPVTTAEDGSAITVSYYRLEYKSYPSQYGNQTRYKGHGKTIPAGQASDTQELIPGTWEVKIRAFSSDDVPSAIVRIQ